MFTEPVTGKDFFGRDKILEVLSKRVGALKSGYRQNVALTGKMLSGKSSILHHFLESLNDASIVPIYIEVVDEPFVSFANKFIGTLLYNFFKSENIHLPKDMECLINKAEEVIPRTIELIKKIRVDLANRIYNRAYRELLDLTSVLKEETQKSCVVILDEFHNLENFRIKNVFLHLGKIIMIQKNTMYIVSSSQRNKIRKILSEKLSLLFGNFEIMEVSSFGSKTAKLFLKEKISPIHMSEYYNDYILNLTDRNPFYLDVISKKIKTLAEASGILRVNIELIKDVFRDILYGPTGTINQHFTNNIHFLLDRNLRKQYLSILFALAQGAGKIKDISSFFNGKRRGLSKKLDFLINIDLVFKCGVFYKIQDRLFEFWLRNVYFKKENILIDTPHERANEFNGLVENDIENYLIEYNKGVLERLRDLFHSFNGEIVEIDRKLRKLQKFIKIEVLKYGGDKNYLTCEKSNRYWVCQIKYNRTEENDIIDFIHEENKRIKTAKRLILIPLNGIDSTALLLAKEKHIWVWKPNSLNSLLRLYRKQDLII